MEQKGRTYKDTLFRFIFGRNCAESKEAILSLYNALNDTDYTDVSAVQLLDTESIIYMSMRSDTAFAVEYENVSLWEQQGSLNPNMPFRGFLYFAQKYYDLLSRNRREIYKSKLYKMPSPQFVVFYNGTREAPAVEKLRLSDAFVKPPKKLFPDAEHEAEFEWTATVININSGKNDALLEKCRPLRDYMKFVNIVRESAASGMSTEEAVNTAIKTCYEQGIMADFVKKYETEVKTMCLLEYDFEEELEAVGEEKWEEGRAKGRAEGEARGRAEGVAHNILSFLEDYGYPSEELREHIMRQTNLELLNRWVKLSARVNSIEEFEEKIGFKGGVLV